MTIVVCNYDVSIHKNLANKHDKFIMIDNTVKGYGYTPTETVYDQSHENLMICFKDAVSVAKYVAKNDIKEIYTLDESCELHLVPVNGDLGIESILFHAYGIVTQQNSFLSRHLVEYDASTDLDKKNIYTAKLNSIANMCSQKQQKTILELSKKFID